MADQYGDLGFQSAPAAPAAANPHADLGFTPAAQPAQPSANPSMNASMSAAPEPQGLGGKLSRWAQNVSDDIRYGTDLTGVGSVLKKMGAHGVYQGAPEQVGEFMASLPLGLLRATKGAGEVATPGQRLQGAQDIAGGALQASQIPATFVGGPEVGEVGQAGLGTKAVSTAGKTAAKVGEMIPSAERAGGKFSEVMSAAGDIPINVNAPGNTALRIQELANSGGSMPKVVRDFLKRVTDPEKGAMTYSEARDFYSNATKLSADEARRLTPVMRRQVSQFTFDLNKAVSEAADQAGKLDQYRSAMNEYHKAMQIRAVGRDLKDLAKNKVAQGVGAGVGGAAGAYAVKKLLE